MSRTSRSTAVLLLGLLGLAATFFLTRAISDDAPKSPTSETRPVMNELRQRLTPEQYRVAIECGTEPAFRNPYWNNKAAGLYVCIVSGRPLFSSVDKYDSGTGWPSFTRPVENAVIEEVEDRSHGMRRIEVRSRPGDSHLGHVFPDGPDPSGLRYCINSAALRFIPVEDLEREGYAEYLSLFRQSAEVPADPDPK